MSSIAPLDITYSFSANRLRATDNVDLAQLDAVLGQIVNKLNEIKTALDVTTRDDNQLADGCVSTRNISNDLLEQMTVIANGAVVQ